MNNSDDNHNNIQTTALNPTQRNNRDRDIVITYLNKSLNTPNQHLTNPNIHYNGRYFIISPAKPIQGRFGPPSEQSKLRLMKVFERKLNLMINTLPSYMGYMLTPSGKHAIYPMFTNSKKAEFNQLNNDALAIMNHQEMIFKLNQQFEKNEAAFNIE